MRVLCENQCEPQRRELHVDWWPQQGPISRLSSDNRKSYRIYAWIDPVTRQAHYVGQTANTLHLRRTEHLRSAGRTRKNEWVRGMLESGIEPEIVLLEEVIGLRRQAADREQHWIGRLRAEGHPLTN
ncbi:GIY-YIG nuclease family protein [Microbacterium sp. LMC-P-041]|uniref:GIY-YIG nuclease family protein n=1 Tax=Microbacterium sp. LMC-P-041 TaxID=3040293 RepID=UPI003305CF0F